MTDPVDKIDEILNDFQGDIIQSTKRYGENIYNSMDYARDQAKAALKQLIVEEKLKLLDNLKPVGSWTAQEIETRINNLQGKK